MAKLNSASTTIEITPYKRETPTSNWFDTIIAIEYHIQEQNSRFELPSHGVSIQLEDFNRLINETRNYIKTLPIQSTHVKRPFDTYHFFPLESSFDIQFSSGSYFDNNRQDGTIFIDFKMSLRALGISFLSSDKIGCVVQVKIRTVLDFLDILEQEIKGIITP